MYKRIQDLKEKLPKQHQDVPVLTQHIFNALDNLVEEHRRYVGTSATAGIKPEGEVEKTFFHTINEVKHIILTELEKTTQDIEHIGDKNWEKNYKDGID